MQAIEAIIEASDRHAPRPMDWGEALLYAYLAKAHGSASHRRRAEATVERAIDALDRDVRSLSLYGGVAGVAWLSAHVDRLLASGQEDDVYEDIDRTLTAAAAPSENDRQYDLISGLVGYAVYFLERTPSAAGLAGLSAVIASLSNLAVIDGHNITWHTPAVLVPERQRGIVPDGYYNLGVAHGVPGVIGLLADAERIVSIGPRTQLVATGHHMGAQSAPRGRLVPVLDRPRRPPPQGRPSLVLWGTRDCSSRAGRRSRPARPGARRCGREHGGALSEPA